MWSTGPESFTHREGAANSPSFTPTGYQLSRLRDVTGQRGDPSPQASASALSLLARRLGLLTLAVFVVVMHHVVGAHPHGDATSGMSSAGMSTMTAPAVHTHGAGSTPTGELRDTAAVGMAAAAGNVNRPQASAVVEPDAEPDILAMLHMCLAVLAAVVVIVALFLAVTTFGPLSTVTVGRAGSPSEFPRPPPSQRRLAHLQVLRL